MDERRFTDEQVREILKKAVERAPSRALARKEGMSLAELKTIGAEVGIDPARLEDAARSVTQVGLNRPNRLLGGPTLLNFERRVQGAIGPEDTPEALSLIRRNMGVQGEAGDIHGSLEWSSKGEAGERHVAISERDGTTTIRSTGNLASLAVLTYLPMGILGFIGTLVGFARFAKGGSEIGLLIALTLIPVMYPFFRAIFGRFSQSEAEKLQRVVDDLALLAEEAED